MLLSNNPIYFFTAKLFRPFAKLRDIGLRAPKWVRWAIAVPLGFIAVSAISFHLTIPLFIVSFLLILATSFWSKENIYPKQVAIISKELVAQLPSFASDYLSLISEVPFTPPRFTS